MTPHKPSKHSEETKQKLRVINLGKKHTPKTKHKISKSQIGHIVLPETRKKIGDSHRGELSVKWKGDNVGYAALHDWVRKYLGTPLICKNCNRTNLRVTQYNWANKSGKYKRKLTDWIRLCVKCHRAFDKRLIKVKI